MKKSKLVCSLCNLYGENHHIKTRGSGGKDDDWNLIPLCRNHHMEIHRIGPIRFLKKYSKAKEIFAAKGWYISDEFGRKRLRNAKLENKRTE